MSGLTIIKNTNPITNIQTKEVIEYLVSRYIVIFDFLDLIFVKINTGIIQKKLTRKSPVKFTDNANKPNKIALINANSECGFLFQNKNVANIPVNAASPDNVPKTLFQVPPDSHIQELYETEYNENTINSSDKSINIIVSIKFIFFMIQL